MIKIVGWSEIEALIPLRKLCMINHTKDESYSRFLFEGYKT